MDTPPVETIAGWRACAPRWLAVADAGDVPLLDVWAAIENAAIANGPCGC